MSHSLISHVQRIYSGYPLELCSKCYNISINLHFKGVWEKMKLFRVVRTCKKHKHYSYNAHLKNKCVIRTQCIVKSHFPVLLQMITKFMAHNITSKYNCIHRIQMLSISCFFKEIKLNLYTLKHNFYQNCMLMRYRNNTQCFKTITYYYNFVVCYVSKYKMKHKAMTLTTLVHHGLWTCLVDSWNGIIWFCF